MAMFGKKAEPVADSKITQTITLSLANKGIRAPCKVTVTTLKGSVTLTGLIQYEHQRPGALAATRGVNGVKRVVDNMRVMPKAPAQHGSSARG